MKQLVLLVVFMAFTYVLNAQSNVEKIKSIEVEMKAAAAKGDYGKAAELKKEKEILLQIDDAVAKGDYSKAAELKQQLTTLPSYKERKVLELEKQKQQAVKSGDYAKAAAIQKEIEALQNSDSASSVSISSSTIHPEFKNQVFLYNQSTKQFKALEKREGEIKSSAAAAPFYASATSFYFISGNNSTVDFEESEIFVLEVDKGIDPSDLFKLVKFDPDKYGKDRYMPYYRSTGAVYSGSSGQVNENYLNIKFTRINDNVYKIEPETKLPDGNYGYMMGNKFFCFKVGTGVSKETVSTTTETAPKRKTILKRGFYIDGAISIMSFTDYYVYENYDDYEDNFGLAYSGTNLGVTLSLGCKWYFGSNEMYRPGLNLNFLRLGIYPGDNFMIHAGIANVGFSNIIEFKPGMGLEANFNFGFNVLANLNISGDDYSYYDDYYGDYSDYYDDYYDDYYGFYSGDIGIGINPEVKFRFNKLAVGMNYYYSNLVNGNTWDPCDVGILSFTFGIKM